VIDGFGTECDDRHGGVDGYDLLGAAAARTDETAATP
jgi:hypothetical protein